MALLPTTFGFSLRLGKPLLFFILCLSMISCDSHPQDDEKPAPKAILEINNKGYSLEEFRFFLSQTYPELGPDEDDELLSHALDQFKQEIILAELANYSGYFVSEDQVADFIEKKLTTMSFHLKSNQDRTFWQAIIRRRLAIQELLQNETLKNTNISDQEIQNYYQNHKSEYEGETLYQIRVVQIANEEKVDELLEVLKKSKEPFSKVVAPFAENDGYRITQAFPLDGLIPPFQKAVRNMRPGRHSKPIPVKQGELTVYYVLYLVAVLPPKAVSYEEAHYDIQAKLRQAQAKSLLDRQIEQFLARLPLRQVNDHLPFRYIEPDQRSSSQ